MFSKSQGEYTLVYTTLSELSFFYQIYNIKKDRFLISLKSRMALQLLSSAGMLQQSKVTKGFMFGTGYSQKLERT